MKQKKEIIFILLELIFGIGIGISGTYFYQGKTHYSGLTDGFFYLILTYWFFILIGIGIPGFFYCKNNDKNKNFIFGIIYALIGILFGIIFGVILSNKAHEFLDSEISSIIAIVCIPTICGVIGFNKGIK